MAVHHAVGISRQRNSGYRPSRVNIVAQGLSMHSRSPLSPTHPTIRRGRATTTHYTHHQVSLMVSRNTTLVLSLGLRIGPACEAGLSADMRRERVSPQIRKKKERKKDRAYSVQLTVSRTRHAVKTLSNSKHGRCIAVEQLIASSRRTKSLLLAVKRAGSILSCSAVRRLSFASSECR